MIKDPHLVSKGSSTTDEFNELDGIAECKKPNSIMESFRRWIYSNSIWPIFFGVGCCFEEVSSEIYYEELGIKMPAVSPRHADLLIVSGVVTEKMAPVLKKIYDQMPYPKWVIALGNCASSGGIYNTYSVVQGVGSLIPVDIYVPGCPVTAESLSDAIKKLKIRIVKGTDSQVLFDTKVSGAQL